MLRAAAGQKELPIDSAETELKGLDTMSPYMGNVCHPGTTA